MCSLSFQDILSRPQFSRKDSTPLFTNIQQSVKSNEGTTIFKISDKLIDLASEYTKFEEAAFHNEYPDYVYPYFIGITFFVDYNILGKTGVKRAKIKRLFAGNKEEGFYISKPAYGKHSYLPKHSKFKENILSFFKSPRNWLKNRYHMRLMQAELDYQGINNALIYGTITKKQALKEMKKVKKVTTSKKIEDFIVYLEKNID